MDSSTLIQLNKISLYLLIIPVALFYLFKINSIPSGMGGGERILSGLLMISSGILVYFSTLGLWKNRTVSLLSVFWFYFSPVILTYGRLLSPIPSGIFLIVFLFFSFIYFENKLFKALSFIIFIILLKIIYPSFYLFNSFFDYKHYSVNFFKLISGQFLFFTNDTFWWGGAREYGILFLAVLPFLIFGLYDLLVIKGQKLKLPLYFIFSILILSAGSPHLPESQEFLLAIPFFAMILGKGAHLFFSSHFSTILKYAIILSFAGFFTYQLIDFTHYYFIHYSLRVRNEASYHATAF
ncbi:MAG: hypothetical protein UT63_C0003G0021 [Candidatus Gottesmanbacteria bacterium GW2011_GWC2_39_8]|uniref:Glycosyltransferase RgtA/B/C/D-like domain-containing protein n=1 Tax=Candidatus Gottesmanbacteria bacterium GW2011_GWC2_39_8 TaxID=1618450 RepID=A0A0G0SHX8_9BACT|nr:MAG: hypothetical protein UT63_C0003G0021 [Candidatus Gottesmanbacteria bacterium GW2011_GWC2_39_8]